MEEDGKLKSHSVRGISGMHKILIPGEAFRVLKEKELRLYGEYRTRRLVLEAWEKSVV